MSVARFDRRRSDDLDSLPLGNLLQRLTVLAPQDAEAIRVIAIECLKRAIDEKPPKN